MHTLPLPQNIVQTKAKNHKATFTIEPLYPGYGMTVGNALRRVLLSSLEGGSITSVKFDGANHEFSALPYVKEDVVDIILNLKLVRLKLHGDEPVTVTLNAKGAKVVTAGDIQTTSDVEVTNPDQVIATLTDEAAKFSLELTVGKGRGYVPVETRDKEKADIGTIAIDAIYTPVKNVNFTTQNVRVGQMTNFDKLLLEITTDGTIEPAEALRQAAEIMVSHFQFVMENSNGNATATEEKAEAPTEETEMAEDADGEDKPKRKTRKKKTDEE